jgi:hypothetical protein
MPRVFLWLAFLLWVIVFGAYSSPAQEKGHLSLKTLRGFTPERYTKTAGRVHEHTMYPLGFSEDGSFAYLAVQADTAAAGGPPYFRIVNLISDQQLYLETFEPGGDVDGRDIESILMSREKQIRSVLERFNIAPAPSAGIQRFPYEYQDDIIDAVIHREPIAGKSIDECGGRRPEQIEIILKSRKRGVKVIAGYDTCASNTPDIEAIEGFIKNPLEERIVVLASGTQYVSGDRWDAKFYPVGANLTSGFVRP